MSRLPYLKSLEIKGFKSFAERTFVEFTPGINVIVGPNGCGKSNLVDAIHWVFGIHSARDLRGEEHDDLIFSGSERRAPMGFAEVKGVLVAEDGFSHPLFSRSSEVEVYRRWNRGEHSEYRLNAVRVRLRDIVDFLYALGWGSFSLIHQDTIQEISLLSPQALRKFLEESSGISRFYLRREEALQRLEEIRRNLVEVSRVIKILEERRSLLKIQAESAQRVLSLKEQEKRFALILFHIDRDKQEKELKGAEELSQNLKGALEEKREALDRTYEEIHRLGKEEEADLHQRRLLISREEELRTELDRLRNRLAELNREKELGREEIRQHELILVSLHDEENKIREARDLIALEVEKAKQELGEILNAMRELEEIRHNRLEEEERIQSDRLRIQDELIQILEEEARIRRELEGAEIRRRDLVILRERGKKHLDSLSTQAKDLSSELAGSEGKIFALEEDRKELSRKIEEAEREREARIKSLRSLKELQERVAYDLEQLDLAQERLRQNLLKLFPLPGKENDYAFAWNGIELPPEKVDLWETILGEKLKVLFPRSQDLFLHLIEQFRRGELKERVTVFAPSGTSSTSLPHPSSRYVPLEVIIRISPDYAWVRSLLSGVYFTREPLNPPEIPPDLPEDLRELWDEHGVVYIPERGFTFGPCQRFGVAHIQQKMAELFLTRQKLVEELQSLTAQAEEVATGLKDLELKLQGLKEDHARIEREHNDLHMKIYRCRLELQRVEEDLRLTQTEQEDLLEEEEELKQMVEERERAWAELSTLRQKKQDEFALITQELERHRSQGKEFIAQYEHLMVERKKVETRVNDAEDKLHEVEFRLSSLSQESQRSQERIDFWQVRLKDLEREMEDYARNCELSQSTLNSIKEDLQEIETRSLKRSQLRRNLEEQLVLKQKEVEHLGAQKARAEEKALFLREKMKEAERVFREVYGDIPEKTEILEDLSRERLEAEISRIRKEIQEAGPVNFQAIEELEAVDKEYTRLTAEQEDLEASLAKAQRLLEDMDREARTRFLSYLFEVNRQFYALFEELSGGGKGELRLEDERDWLKSGIEILLQFPGARRVRRELLSGGQKALTSIALLCALFLSRPGPCLVLDEVDAPLDEVNLKRFHELLGRLSQRTQLIVVTHHPLTMAIAHRIIGVTQKERGVSTLIPYHLV